MKYLSILILFVIGLFPSCQKSPINGDLDGQWQVLKVTPAPEEVFKTRIYICFSLHTCQLTAYDVGPWTSGNILKFSPSTLELEFPHANSAESVQKLRQYGINSSPVTFSIESLTKKTLILRDGETIIELRKF
ncbi:MAG: lipocalin-like domain-containing protein [Muribaculaceae bacterium]|nr:lipocalin-like domain-containing protein [Muribaculaceae bacterium]